MGLYWLHPGYSSRACVFCGAPEAGAMDLCRDCEAREQRRHEERQMEREWYEDMQRQFYIEEDRIELLMGGWG